MFAFGGVKVESLSVGNLSLESYKVAARPECVLTPMVVVHDLLALIGKCE